MSKQIKIPRDRENTKDVWVGINGKTWLIKRGEFVTVPDNVAAVLERKEKMLNIAMDYEAEASGRLSELESMH